MITPPPHLPVVRQLPRDFSLERAFSRLSSRPGCLWLDSASAGPRSSDQDELGRYSFLTSDPLESLVVSIDDCDPWPTIDRWQRRLPSSTAAGLPPFQGGIAGLIGYEAASWLEPVGVARRNDLPTPTISLGLYDWTIATDHQLNRSWVISQGFGSDNPIDRYQAAVLRADEVEAILATDHHASTPATVPPCSAGVESRPGVDSQHATSEEDVCSNFSSDRFQACVAEIVGLICDGDSFQVNLAQRLLKRAGMPSAELYMRLRASNPAPFGAFYRGDGFEVLSSSPEGFVRLRDGRVETRPIKGTVPRTGDVSKDERLASELTRSEKDRAENVMIVDLMRNDLSRVCTDESVKVKQLCEIERYEYVQHLVSVIEGNLRHDKSAVDLLRACFPGGSVTGAPKIEAMRTIARLEPSVRGPYCGSIGYISCGGDADFNILIRTITAAHGYWQIPVGGGITARSDPASEEAETWAKAEGMLRAMR